MEKGKISALQMAILLYPTILATAILSMPAITAKYAGNDLWISSTISSFIGFLTVYIAVRLHNIYPGKTAIQICEDIAGRIPGKVIGFIILYFYIQSTGLITRSYSEFIVSSFLFKTPQIVVISLMVLLCAFCIHGGLEVLGRAGQLLFPLLVVPLFAAILFLARDFEFGNILPVLDKGIVPPLKGSVAPAGWFAEFFLIAFLLPFLSDKKKGMKYGMTAVLSVMITIVFVDLLVLFVLGATTANKVYPLMNVVRYAKLSGFFENMEAVVMAVWIVGAFVKISVFYYAGVLGTAQWLNLSDYRPIIWPVGIFVVQFSFWAEESMMDLTHYLVVVFPFFSVFVQVIIPALLLMIAFFRREKVRPKTQK
ncbi:endospore germination permease [Siminovitchia sp. FSL W7-1587]|uniref:GerAB/ArcD/ProY family transporter n=1 Tax=Siminovitchia sp. FSL W7-1587 TaxID=2954699 RepID=UPI0030CB7026